MPHVGWIVRGTFYTLDEALAIAREDGVFDRFPAGALEAMTDRDGKWTVPASGGSTCARQRILRIFEPYALEPKQQWAMLVGRGIHAELETDREGDEMFLQADIAVTTESGTEYRLPVRGRIDNYEAEYDRLIDYKTTKRLKYKRGKTFVHLVPKDGHFFQVNVYAFLLRENGYPVDELKLWYVTPEGSRKWVDAPLWDQAEMRGLLEDVALPLAEAHESGTLPPPTLWLEDDHPNRWLCDFCPVVDACINRWERFEDGDSEAEQIPEYVLDMLVEGGDGDDEGTSE